MYDTWAVAVSHTYQAMNEASTEDQSVLQHNLVFNVDGDSRWGGYRLMSKSRWQPCNCLNCWWQPVFTGFEKSRILCFQDRAAATPQMLPDRWGNCFSCIVRRTGNILYLQLLHVFTCALELGDGRYITISSFWFFWQCAYCLTQNARWLLSESITTYP